MTSELQRPNLGDWLTVSAVQTQDPDWFIVGGGPKLALWNKRAGKHTVILDAKSKILLIMKLILHLT